VLAGRVQVELTSFMWRDLGPDRQSRVYQIW